MKMIANHGFLNIHGNDRVVILTYGGNMGNKLSDVANSFDKLYGDGMFRVARDIAKKVDGAPDFLYTMVFNRNVFDKNFTRVS